MTNQRSSIQALTQVPERHRQVVAVIVETLRKNGGRIFPQKALVPLLLAEFKKYHIDQKFDLDGSTLTEYVRKYECVGLFKREVFQDRQSCNILELTALGRELPPVSVLFPEEPVSLSPASWCERTKFRVETYLRGKRSFLPGTVVDVNELLGEILKKAPEFGLKHLSRAESALALLQAVISSRFSPEELELSDTNRFLMIHRGLR